MRTLTPAELARLRRSRSRLHVSALLALCLLIAFTIGLAVAGLPVAPGPILGILIGLLLLVPYRRVLRELGLTTAEANAILLADREERRGIAALTPVGRAARETRMARICLTVGLVAAAGFILAVLYLIRDAGARSGQPIQNGGDESLWVPISIFGGFGALIVALIFLVAAGQYRKQAGASRAARQSGPESDQ